MKNPARAPFHIFVACSLFILVGSGLIVNCLGILLPFISRSMGYSTVQVSLIVTLRALFGMITTTFSGRWMQRFRLPNYLTFVCISAAACTGLTVLCKSLWQIYICSALTGLALGLAVYSCGALIVSGWFLNPRYVGAIMAVPGIGGMVFSPIVSWVASRYGWRGGYLFVVAMMLLIMLPCSRLLIASSAKAAGFAPHGDTETVKKPVEILTVQPPQQVNRSASYYYVLAFFALAALASCTYAHLPNMMLEKGVDPLQAGTLNSLFQLGVVVGPLAIGAVYPGLHARKSAALICMLGIMGCAVLYAADGKAIPALAVSAILLGVARAGLLTVGTFLVKEAFGLAQYARCYSQMMAVYVLICGLGSAIYGYLYHLTDSYRAVYGLVGLTLLLTIASASAAIRTAKRLHEVSSRT